MNTQLAVLCKDEKTFSVALTAFTIMFYDTHLDTHFKRVLENFNGRVDDALYEAFFHDVLEGAYANCVRQLNSRRIRGKDAKEYALDAALKVIPRLLVKIQNGDKPECGPVALTHFAVINVLFKDSEKQKDRETGDIDVFEGSHEALLYIQERAQR